MIDELIALYGSVYTNTQTSETKINVTHFVTEVQSFGYIFTAKLQDKISHMYYDDFKKFRDELLTALQDFSGSHNFSMVPLFKKFPYETPDVLEYFLKRIISISFTAELINDPKILSCGHIVSLFDLDEFSACPVCQYQVQELYCDSIPEKHVFNNANVEYKVLQLIDNQALANIGLSILTRQSSLSQQERQLLTNICRETKIDTSKISKMYNENIPLLYSIDPLIVPSFLKGATDVLRIITYLSDNNADLSLAENTKYKLTTSQKKSMLRLLEGLSNLPEDMLRHREKWLRVGERINPKQYPKFSNANAAFDIIRNNPKSVKTFSKIIDQALRTNVIDDDFVKILGTRPGEFMRKLNAILVRTDFHKNSFLVKTLYNCVQKSKTRILFDILKYFENQNTSARIFFPKGPSNRSWVEEKPHQKPDNTHLVISVIKHELITRFARGENTCQSYYIDPELKYSLLPFNRRGDAATNVNVTKGSLLFVKEPVIRLFTWWKGNVDVDLSLVLYDCDFKIITHISYRLLKNNAMRHSGDIQDAPNGASEYIDVDIEQTTKDYPDARYAAIQLNVYRGAFFNEFPCFVGYMERDSITSGKLFEPETVKLKFDVNDSCRVTCPMIFDFEKKAVIFTNLQLGKTRYSNASSNNRLEKIAKSFVTLYERKTTIYDVLQMIAWTNGSIVQQKSKADIIFDSSNIDIDYIYKMIDDSDLKIK